MKTFLTHRPLFFTITILVILLISFTQKTENQQFKYNFIKHSGDEAPQSATFDLRVVGIVAPNFRTPVSQLECFTLGGTPDCYQDPAEVLFTMHLNIFDDNTGIEVFHDSLSNATDCEEIYELFDCFTPPQVVTSYTAYLSINSNQIDPDLENNFDTIHFEITENTFSKEDGGTMSIAPHDTLWDPTEPHSWAYGNFYHIVDGINYAAESASFSIGNASDPGIEGRLITFFLYKWVEDSNEDGRVDPNERTRVGFYVYEIQGNEQPNDIITVPLLNFPTGDPDPVPIESDQNYVLMIEYTTLDQVNLELVVNDKFNYLGMWSVSEFYLGNPRFGSHLAVNGDLSSEPYDHAGFSHYSVPVARLNLVEIGPNSLKTEAFSENWLKISPNPAVINLNVEIDFPEPQKEALIKIYDLNGRLMKQENYKNIKYEKINFDLTKFAAGTYFLQLVTDAGVRTERFVVQHF